MSLHFRPALPEDAPLISKFLREAFRLRPEDPLVEPRHMAWRYWDPWPGWSGSRSFIITSGDEIAAHGAVVPLDCVWEGGRLSVIRIIDWAASPKPVGSGVVLLKRIAQLTRAILAVGGTQDTLRVFAALGAAQYGAASRYVLPMRPLRRFLGDIRTDWRAAPRLARSWMWKMNAPVRTLPGGWYAKKVQIHELTSQGFPPRVCKPGLAIFQRSHEILAHYLQSPTVPFELYTIHNQQGRRGHFLLSRLPRQVRLTESWIESDRLEDWQALHMLAVREAFASGDAVELSTLGSDPLTEQSLLKCGFKKRGELRLQLLKSSNDIQLPQGTLRVQMLEGDAGYLNDGTLLS